MKLKIFIFFICFITLSFNVLASVCRIKGDAGEWYLEVDGNPFELKGVGCGQEKGREGTDYLQLAKVIGANAVRTWGTDQGTKEYLDAAEHYGLKVDAGIWFEHCNWMRQKKVFSYINDVERLKKMEKDALGYVEKFKNHPAIIMWNLGNEVLFFTNEEKERIAFCKYLEKVARKVKELDPDHPVLYTASGGQMFSYLKKYVPSLDIIGVNTYGGVDYIQDYWNKEGIEIPYMITEAGPLGPWDCPKDEFGRSIDQADYEKAFHYQYLLEEIDRFKGYCLGGFMFHLGDTTQESLTWWNLTVGPLKRESFCVIEKYYTGHQIENMPPLCIGLEIDKKVVCPGERISVNIKARDREKDDLSYDVQVGTSKENILLHIVNEAVPVEVVKKGVKTVFVAPEEPGIYKLHAYVYDGKGNVSTRTISFKVEEQKEITENANIDKGDNGSTK